MRQKEKVKSMINKIGLEKTEFMKENPQSVLMPIIITMPMTLIKNPDKIGSIDFNFIEACKCMQKKQFVKAYKFFKICED